MHTFSAWLHLVRLTHSMHGAHFMDYIPLPACKGAQHIHRGHPDKAGQAEKQLPDLRSPSELTDEWRFELTWFRINTLFNTRMQASTILL